MRRYLVRLRVLKTLGHGLARASLVLVPGGMAAACAGGQTVNELKARDFFADAKLRALAEAAARGDSAEVAHLVREGANPNGAGREGMVPLVWAMGKRSHAGMHALLAAGANPNVEGPAGLKPLELAAKSTDPELLRILLDAKGDPSARNSDGEALLHVAVMGRVPANVALLLERGADVNGLDGGHVTPVKLAAAINQWELAAMLLERGADPTIPDFGGGSVAFTMERAGAPTEPAARQAYDRVRQLLTERGVRFPAERPADVRRRVFGPDNPIDARRRHEAAERASP